MKEIFRDFFGDQGRFLPGCCQARTNSFI